MKKLLFLVTLISSINLFSQRVNIESFTKDFEKKEGFINYYWDDNNGKLYFEIENLDKELIYVNYLSAGVGSNDIGLDRGQIGGTRIIKFIKIGPKMLMVQPNYKFRALSKNTEEINSVNDAFARSTIWGFQIEAKSGNSYLIDATEFVMRDSHMIISRLFTL